MELKLNLDYARRHLFVTLLMLGLGIWFGYDGFVRYPNTDAAELYRSIENSDPSPEMNLEKFKLQKTQTQYGFCALALLAAFVVGFRLKRAYDFKFSYDDSGFTVGKGTTAKYYAYSDIKSVDTSRWDKKSILTLILPDRHLTLDGWHHLNVKEFNEFLSH